MTQITEIVDEKPSVLIVSEKNRQFVQLLKNELRKYKAEIYFSPVIPPDLRKFDYCFFINAGNFTQTKFPRQKKVIFVYLNNRQIPKEVKSTEAKIIQISGDKIRQNHIDQILWFTFSQTNETFLHLTATKKHLVPDKKLKFPEFKIPNRKKLLRWLIYFLLLMHIAFIFPLLTSSYLLYKGGTAFKQENFGRTEKFLNLGRLFLTAAKKLYFLPRTTYLLFSFKLSEDIFAINEKSYLAIYKSVKLQENLREALKIILNPESSAEDKRQLKLRFDTIKSDVNIIEESISVLIQKFPLNFKSSQNFKKDLAHSLDLLTRLKQILPHFDSIFAQGTEKNYLLLFANNMELRPGGGFIGSFGLLKIKDYSVKEIRIYDVYDADGQLTAHVEPPMAIREFLDQPHWFLRDSAFSPDFLENYIQAKLFLEKELNFKNFSGSFLITTTAIQNILGAFNDIYLPDFQEKINQKNFYLKTQYHSEKDFFPGSIQKKNFLSSLTKSLLLNLENASYFNLAKGIIKSFDEKQVAVYLDDPIPQKIIDSLYWSGRTLKPLCINQNNNCIIDYIFPVDANLGFNKVNFFVSRLYNLRITINKQGEILNALTVKFNNDSADVFPGGVYRNYFQLLLPRNAVIKDISRDGTAVDDFSESIDEYKRIGVLLEVIPKSMTELKINYRLSDNIQKGKHIYQLIIQKQTGASNSDFSLQINLPNNIHLLNQNFLALVKDRQMIYNTSLSADKIFFVELIKE